MKAKRCVSFVGSAPGGSRTWMVCCSLQRWFDVAVWTLSRWWCSWPQCHNPSYQTVRLATRPKGITEFHEVETIEIRITEGPSVLCLAFISASDSFATRCRSFVQKVQSELRFRHEERPGGPVLKSSLQKPHPFRILQNTSFCCVLHSLCSCIQYCMI